MNYYYVGKEGKPVGPVSYGQLKNLFRKGVLDRRTLLLKGDDAEQWQTIFDLSQPIDLNLTSKLSLQLSELLDKPPEKKKEDFPVTHKKKHFNIAQFAADDDEPEFQIAPMVDMLLVLLIFFMSITTTDVMMKDAALVLPDAVNGKKPDKKTDLGQTIINVRWDTHMAIAQTIVDQDAINSPAVLTQQLAARKKDYEKSNPRAKYRVIVRADEHVQYRYIQEIMKACGGAGINNITFSVMKEGEYTKGGG